MPVRFEVFNLFNLFALLWSPDFRIEELFADSYPLAGKKTHIKIQWWDLEPDSGWKWLITEVSFITKGFCLAQFDWCMPTDVLLVCHPCF